MMSREHHEVLKRDKYTCVRCGVKQTKAGKDKDKWIIVQVHHKLGIANWDALFEAVYQFLLTHPDDMETLCKKCHKESEL
jgi:5-methylcytosine-specific restriction endonuclease McrA